MKEKERLGIKKGIEIEMFMKCPVPEKIEINVEENWRLSFTLSKNLVVEGFLELSEQM